jgi:hypothetical protein
VAGLPARVSFSVIAFSRLQALEVEGVVSVWPEYSMSFAPPRLPEVRVTPQNHFLSRQRRK